MNALLQQFAAEAQQEWDIVPRYNVSPTQLVPVIRQVDGSRELSMIRWGLVPPWAEAPNKGPVLNNARSEEAAQKPTFKNIIKNRRCLILADGFYEWEKTGKDGKIKLPHYFGTRGFKPFAFAGLWQVWQHGEVPLESCTILTTHANDMVGKIHDRMPVILSPNDYDVWLNPEMQNPAELTYLYEPYPAGEMETYRVDPKVNSSRNEGEELIQPLEPPAVQADLF
jgi:putative SOS response-associated peptidase YedK